MKPLEKVEGAHWKAFCLAEDIGEIIGHIIASVIVICMTPAFYLLGCLMIFADHMTKEGR